MTANATAATVTLRAGEIATIAGTPWTIWKLHNFHGRILGAWFVLASEWESFLALGPFTSKYLTAGMMRSELRNGSLVLPS